MGKSFFDCLPVDPERWAKAFQALSDCREADCGAPLELPKEPKQKPQEIPVDTEMDEEEIATFMAEAPHHPKRIV